jgi:hypothetical protein
MCDIQTNEDNISVVTATSQPSDNLNHPMGNTAVESTRNQSDALANDAALLFRSPKKIADPVMIIANSMETDPKKNADIIMEGDEADSNKKTDIELGNHANGAAVSKVDKPIRSSRAGMLFCKTLHVAKEDLNYLHHFLVNKKKPAIMYAKSVLDF